MLIFPKSVPLKIGSAVLLLSLVIAGWFWLDYNDYYNHDYRNLTEQERKQFDWQDRYSPSGVELKKVYKTNFNNSEFEYPIQKVKIIKLYKNIPLLAAITGKTLNERQTDYFLRYCNDPNNFEWNETTWSIWEAEYYFKLYNEAGTAVGKIYFCLDGCMQIEARPFSPRMKFGGLSEKGLKDIQKFVDEIRG